MKTGFPAIGLVVTLTWLQARPATGAEIVAVVNGEPITAVELEESIKPQLEQISEQLERLRRTMLLKLIDNRLLEQASHAEGVSVEAYLRRHVERVTVSDQEVEEAYQRSRQQFPGALAPEAKYRIRRALEDRRRADALSELLGRLRRSARIENRLSEEPAPAAAMAAEEGPTRGATGAAVTIVEFSDFECPFSRRAAAVISRVVEKWSGQVRHVFRHFPLGYHRHAFDAAKAAVCAEQQGRLWEFREGALREGQELSPAGLAALAAAVALDRQEFARCMSCPQTAERVRRDVSLGRRMGVTGTPAVLVNGRKLHDVERLEHAIIEEFSRSGGTEAPQMQTQLGPGAPDHPR